MSEIFGAVGSIAAAKIQADAIKDATDAQVAALEKQRQFVYDELEPGKVGGMATQADIDRARNKLALQSLIDPELLKQRYEAEGKIGEQLGEIGKGGSEEVSKKATEEALKGVPGMEEAKKKLIDAALMELDAGATLPPDVQAELVKAGLEKTGMVTGAASAKGIGGQLVRNLIGQEGLALQAERQKRAADLTARAQQLEESRQNILGTLFPNLAKVQLENLAGTQRVLQQSNQMMPEAGLSGNDIANLWLSRVGAAANLGQSAANAANVGALNQAQAWNTGFGGALRYGTAALPSTASLFSGGGGNGFNVNEF